MNSTKEFDRPLRVPAWLKDLNDIDLRVRVSNIDLKNNSMSLNTYGETRTNVTFLGDYPTIHVTNFEESNPDVTDLENENGTDGADYFSVDVNNKVNTTLARDDESDFGIRQYYGDGSAIVSTILLGDPSRYPFDKYYVNLVFEAPQSLDDGLRIDPQRSIFFEGIVNASFQPSIINDSIVTYADNNISGWYLGIELTRNHTISIVILPLL